MGINNTKDFFALPRIRIPLRVAYAAGASATPPERECYTCSEQQHSVEVKTAPTSSSQSSPPADPREEMIARQLEKILKPQQEVPTSRVYAYMHSGCPPTRAELGRATWAFLHTLAAHYPDHPTTAEQERMRTFMHTMSRVYPCPYCADRTAEELERNPPQVASRTEFSRWMCTVHNEVNERMGKPIFDCNKVEERWRFAPKDASQCTFSSDNKPDTPDGPRTQ